MQMSPGSPAPGFSLPDTTNNNATVTLDDYKNRSDVKGLLVMFICNHCPYVIHVQPELVRIQSDYMNKGIQIVAISSNNVETHPDDSPEKMAEEAKRLGYKFPYLYDESQNVARAYGAACTPDFFLFDGNLQLFYRGRLDESSPGNGKPLTGNELREVLDLMLAGKSAPATQMPSMGCNIKWK